MHQSAPMLYCITLNNSAIKYVLLDFFIYNDEGIDGSLNSEPMVLKRKVLKYITKTFKMIILQNKTVWLKLNSFKCTYTIF